MNPPPSLSWRRKLGFAALAVGAALLGLETSARVALRLLPSASTTGGDQAGWLGRLARDLQATGASPGLYVPDSELLWRLQPEQALVLPVGVFETRTEPPRWHLTINRDGHRGPPYPSAGPGPVVVTVGDSCTFGFRVDDDQTYPQQLEGWLRRAGLPTANVVNLGVPGYSSLQGRQVLAATLKRHAPAAVVIAFGANDLEADRLTDADKQAELRIGRLRLLYLSERLATVRLARQLTGGAARTEPTDTTAAVRRVPAAEFADNLRAMIAAARAAGAIVVLADQVFVSPQLRHTIEVTASEAHVPFVDGRQVLRDGLGRLRTDPSLAVEASRIDRFWNDEVIAYRHFYYSDEFFAELFADPDRQQRLRYFMVEPVHANGLGNRLMAEAIGASLLGAGLSANR